ncbi:hypothetical protein PR048_010087 [Dryococelus australis]|uniref:Uncharacterized protein n=1 Tax=Dryococelus australis TaxID=614101 RepID=A0ABQ9I1Q9_9NEOP|nr:hypothetical protein PR048_010087 [Dryococelus australis]
MRVKRGENGAASECGNLGATPPGIEHSSARWEESCLATTPPRPLEVVEFVPRSLWHAERTVDLPPFGAPLVWGAGGSGFESQLRRGPKLFSPCGKTTWDSKQQANQFTRGESAAKFNTVSPIKGPRWCSGKITILLPRRTGFDSRRGRSWILARGNRVGRCRWSTGYLGDLPFLSPLHSRIYLTLFTVIGSQDLDSISMIEASMERHRNGGAEETGDPRENPLTNGIVWHDSYLRKSGDPAGDWTRFALVGGELANRLATVPSGTRGIKLTRRKGRRDYNAGAIQRDSARGPQGTPRQFNQREERRSALVVVYLCRFPRHAQQEQLLYNQSGPAFHFGSEEERRIEKGNSGG